MLLATTVARNHTHTHISLSFSSSKDAVCVIGREGHLDNESVKV